MLKIDNPIVIIALSFYMVIILKLYLGVFLIERQSLMKVAGWLPFFIWQCAINSSQAEIFPATVNLLLSGISLVLSGVLVYEGSRWKRCMFPLFLAAYWMLLEGVVFSVAGLILNSQGGFFIFSLIPKLFLLLTVIGIRRFFKEKGAVRNIYGAGRHLILIPIEQIILYSGFYMLITAGGVPMTWAFFWMVVIGIILIFINLSIYPVYNRILETVQEQQNARLYRKQMELYRTQWEMEEAAASEIREMRHDMKQKLLYLRELAEHGGKESFEEAIEGFIGETAQAGGQVLKTGNLAVDAQVNHLCREAQTGGFVLHTKLNILSELRITDSDLSVFLGNALDNAVEASRKEPAGEVWLTLKTEKGCLLVQVRNRCSEIAETDRQGHLISRKGGENHGLGMRSMERIAKKYHGDIMTEWKNGIFTLHAFLYEEKLECQSTHTQSDR